MLRKKNFSFFLYLIVLMGAEWSIVVQAVLSMTNLVGIGLHCVLTIFIPPFLPGKYSGAVYKPKTG